MSDNFHGFFIDTNSCDTVTKRLYRIGNILNTSLCISTETYDCGLVKVYAEVDGFIPREYVMSFSSDEPNIPATIDDAMCDEDHIYHEYFRDGVAAVADKFIRNYVFGESV